jgi:protein phosphatase
MTDSEIAPTPPSGNGRLERHGYLAKFGWALRSDPGAVREHNEDYAGVYALTIPDDAWDRGPLFVVADGLGGHAAGEVASKVAVDRVVESWAAPASPSAPHSAIRSAIRSANTAVFDEALQHGRQGMGTTVVAATLAGNEVIVAHVGDSRAYLLHAGRCTQVTTDHSRVAEMVRMRLITPEQAAEHPARSMLTRSLGGEPVVQVDLNRHPIGKGDILILCSDGLWDVVGRSELIEIAAALNSAAGPTPDDAAEHLTSLALKRGGPDNVTVLVVRVTSDQPIPSASTRRSLFPRRRR